MGWLILQGMLALVLLVGSADLLVRSASAVGLRLGLSPLAVGLTIVAFGTSAPELFVSLGAVLDGRTDISVGNVVGSNICNVALILGLSALVKPARVHAGIFRVEAPLLVVSSLLLAGMLWWGEVGRLAGALFLTMLVAFTGSTLRATAGDGEVAREEPAPGRSLVVDAALVAGGLVGLGVGGHLLVQAAVTLASAMGVSEALVGLTVVAVGTSLPELATSIVAAARGQGDIAVGNVVGSNLFNILGILGITAMVAPLPQGGISMLDLGVMVGLAVGVLPIMRSGFVVSRLEGGLLLASYVAYVGWRATML